MKKFFKFALVALTALAVLACEKTPKDDPTPTPEPEPEVKVDEELVGTWTITGEAQGWAADGGVAMTESNNVWTCAEVIVKGEGFKFVKDGAWTINLGAAEEGAKADNVEFDLAKDGKNIIGTAGNGVYSVKLNLLTKKASIKFEKELEPEGPTWQYALDIADYHRNSEFHFANPIKVNPKAMTFQWKFYSKKWNNSNHSEKITVDGNEYTLFANRLGQISNSGEKGMLFRFCDGGQTGQLRFNSDILGTGSAGRNADYVKNASNQNYIWSLNEWHVLTIVADGTNVAFYDNATPLYTIKQTTGAAYEEWPVERFDISMTWDDGTRYDSGQAFNGYIAYTRLWDKVLTAEEVAASLCDVEPGAENLLIYWAYDLASGSELKNWGSAEGYELNFARALAGGQSDYVKTEDIEAGWTPVEDIENGTICPAAE